MNDKVHIISEAGTNHNGQLAIAKKLADLSVKAGADSVKFQIIYPEGLYLPGEYWFGHYDIKEVIAMRTKFMMPDNDYVLLNEYCNSAGIPFSASVFDDRGLSLLASCNPPYIKIASTDLNNLSLLRKVAERGIKMIISTGMSSLKDIEITVNDLYKRNFKDIVLMHCVSVYPSRLELMNLGFLDVLKKEFGLPLGFSDHCDDSVAACLALTKGVSFIEKHITLDRAQEGFDHKYAQEEEGFIQYIADIRNAEKALRPPEEKVSEEERYVKRRARRSIFAARAIKKGEIISLNDLLVVRPENEGLMSANEIDLVIGKTAMADIEIHKPLSKDLVE